MNDIRRSKNQGIIAITLFIAIVLTIIPLPEWARYIRPEWVMLVLIYWCMATPARINVGIAWLMGLIFDGREGKAT